MADQKITVKQVALTSTSRFLGRTSAGAGAGEELTGTQATALLDVFASGTKGLTPASGGGTTNFLRADGTWASPPDVAATWGNITGTLSNQTDLQNSLNALAPKASPVFTGTIKLQNTSGTIDLYQSDGTTWNGGLSGNTNTLSVTGGTGGLILDTTSTGILILKYAGTEVARANSTGFVLAKLLTTTASTTSSAGVNLPHGTAPTTPVNGDIWTTTAAFNARLNGVTSSFSGVNTGDQTTVTGQAGFVANSVTFNTSGGAAAGATYNGSAAKTIDYSTIGAQQLNSQLTALAGAAWSAGVQVLTLTAANTVTLKTVGSATGNILDKASGDTLYQPLDGDLTSIAGLAGTTGYLTKTAANTWALDTNTYLTANQTITLSGDVSGSGTTAITTAIGANKVTRSMLAATASAAILGATAAGNVADLTGTQVTTLLDAFTSALKGVVPASGGGTVNFLRADGTWVVPVGSTTSALTFNNAGSGAASGTTFNGSAAQTISYNTLGAAPTASPTFSGTITHGGTTAWINTNQLLLQHDGSNGYVRSQTGKIYLGAGGSNVASFDSAGNLITTGLGDFTSPGSGTTGGLRIRADTQATPHAYMQITSHDASAAWGYWDYTSDGAANWNGTAGIKSNGSVFGTTTNALTFNNAGSGAATGSTFNGSAAQTISYNSIGAPSTTGTNASGTWGISVTGTAASVANALTFATSGGASAGGTFDGSAAVTIDYSTIGAAPKLPQIQSVTSASTVTPTFANDQVNITAQAAALTLANPTGTAADGWGIAIRIKDSGSAQTISYGTQYRAIGVTLPTTTVASKTLYLGMIYNAADTKWDVVSVAQQA